MKVLADGSIFMLRRRFETGFSGAQSVCSDGVLQVHK